jgi:hypothetical protein
LKGGEIVEIQKIEETLRKYRGNKLIHSYLAQLDEKNEYQVNGVELRVILSISSSGGLECMLAEEIAEKYQINFEDYNINRGTDDLPIFKPTFSSVCYDDSEIEGKVKTIIQAEDELRSSFKRIAEIAIKRE